MSRKSLANGRYNKKDEFYTKYQDVKFELDHYIPQFKDKVIYCPCDTSDSAFVKYFLELEAKGLIKELIYTSYKDGVGTDCLSESAIDGYRHSDIIVTNPPFSKFREFISILDKLNKKFILWGNSNALTYKPVVKMIKNNRIHAGYTCNKTCEFEVPADYTNKAYERDGKKFCKVPSCSIFTNLIVDKRTIELNSNNIAYQKYDNFDAINVNKISDIPDNYYGLIGVPITYFYKHDSSKFEILGLFNNFTCSPEDGLYSGDNVKLPGPPFNTKGPVINGSPIYCRLLIKRIKCD